MATSIDPDTHDGDDDWSARFVQEIEQWFRVRYEREGGNPFAAEGVNQPNIHDTLVRDIETVIVRPR